MACLLSATIRSVLASTHNLVGYRNTNMLVNEMLKDALLPHFWRAPTDTDIGNSMQIRCASLAAPAGRSARLDSFNVSEVGCIQYHAYQHCSITCLLSMPLYKVDYTISVLTVMCRWRFP